MTRNTLLMLTVFALLMLGKLLLLLQQPLPEAWHGDAGDYVGKALYFRQHGEFPLIQPVSPTRPTLGYSDFRPPGYPLFIPTLLGFGTTVPAITQAVRLAHFVLDLATTALLLAFVWRFHPAKSYRWLAVLLLGIQPWTSAFIVTLNPDTLTTFLVVVGVGLLAWFVSTRPPWPVDAAGPLASTLARRKTGRHLPIKGLALVGASLLLSLTFLIRPEMIVFAFALILFALALAWPGLTGPERPWHALARYGLLATIPFLAIVGANMAYRWQVAQEVRIFGEFHHATPGLMHWTQTWIGPQTSGLISTMLRTISTPSHTCRGLSARC